MNYFHISMSLKTLLDKEALSRDLNIADDWLCYQPGCWIIKTFESREVWFERLKSYAGQGNTLMIIKVDLREVEGVLPSWIWRWIGTASIDAGAQKVTSVERALMKDTSNKVLPSPPTMPKFPSLEILLNYQPTEQEAEAIYDAIREHAPVHNLFVKTIKRTGPLLSVLFDYSNVKQNDIKEFAECISARPPLTGAHYMLDVKSA